MALRRSARKSAGSAVPSAIPASTTTSVPKVKASAKSMSKAQSREDEVTRSSEKPKNSETRRDELASTPARKRRKIQAEPTTPIKQALNGKSTENQMLPPSGGRRGRVAQPHMTNALLRTPTGSRVIASKNTARRAVVDAVAADQPSPSPETTTENLLETACAHLVKIDSSLKAVIERDLCKPFSPAGLAEEVNPFEALCSSIISQQVSGAAAASIKRKFVALFNEHKSEGEQHDFPKPDQVASTEITHLRTAGLSQRKAEYIQGLAQKFVSREITAQMLVEGSDEEILEKLIAVRGLGKWSVEMFAVFALKRTDILSTGDLGVQRGMAVYTGKDVAKLKSKGGGKFKYMPEQEMLDISAKFAPYRSIFMWYMWRLSDVEVAALDN